MAPAQPELKKAGLVLFRVACSSASSSALLPGGSIAYLDKRLFVQLNGSRKVIGILRGYDVFLNIVLDEAVEEKDGGEKERIGMVVIRGNSVVMLEALERIGGDDRRGDR
ncbi:small nuclear ribonucleoprotein G [Fusarium pseudocircinatum]|uniref:Small nuclear ribonucleoprotein G n=2 Tax=Fusarium fujikuroi species complex TaxID=171627 RepID=A0A8H5UXI9_9HYPO|nr:small nuclear ribonucleoprotein G [Fusarium pseudocircinatum]